MLVIDVSINRKNFIDEIHVQRVGGTPPGNCKYKIIRPYGYEDKIIVHKYSDGCFPLVFKVLKYLKKRGYEPPGSIWIRNSFIKEKK